LALVGATVELGGARDAEIAELDRARATDEDVPRRDVAMYETERAAIVVMCFVCVREASPYRQSDVQRHVGGYWLGVRGCRANGTRRRRSFDELHRHVELAPLFSEVENLHEVGMRELRAKARFVDEHRNELGVGGKLRQDAL
jgi:hypothetical protein